MRVLVTEMIHADALAHLAAAGCEVVEGRALDAAALAAAMAGADAVLIRTRPLPAAALAAAPSVRAISKHGVGCDNIPLEAARAAGIRVTNTPGANAASVAEHALALMLALAKRLPQMDRLARDDWAGARGGPRVVDLAGARLLVVGYGRSGQRVAALAQAFGMEVTILTRTPPASLPAGMRHAADLDSALAAADVVTLHLPLTEATRGLLDHRALSRLPRGALVVNTARGGLIDEAALAALVGAGHLGGAGLDAVAVEPLPADSPLRDLPEVILTPHSATFSDACLRRMGIEAAQNLLDWRDGRLDPGVIVV
jgi:D-3-phosphoglycerate dehydrogenase